jgi:hypothetical protein
VVPVKPGQSSGRTPASGTAISVDNAELSASEVVDVNDAVIVTVAMAVPEAASLWRVRQHFCRVVLIV